MKKTSSMKFLAAVAIVSSAIVMQIRAHVASPEAAPDQARAAMSTCGNAHDGITPASCDSMRRERQPERQQPPHVARQLWV
ncbi:hypothetical protein CI15_32565 [Paraburkholderia monticola]|uniref:Uncharacterized protein n=1 Tax=Paraburkholderia monticola TaxID=1399968 RepID=A0A149PB95_9BURK|nr:hypothetical protein [Paraburkholderia monticola]KXU82290.1 hypothetical protein CI15_32565 [Paraburkholderia monticola]